MKNGFSFRNKGKASAEILIYGDIGDSWFGGVTAKDFAKELKALGKVDTIDVRINSYGGDVFEGLAIYRQLVDHQATITVHIDAIAASIASVIAMAGNEIVIAEAATVMIHNAWGLAIGEAEDMRTMANLLDTTSGTIADVYAARTSANAAQVKAWMDAETWFNAAEAVEHGFAGSIAENLRVAARALDSAKFKFRNAPVQVPSVPAATPNLDAARRRTATMKLKLAARAA